MLFPWTTDAPLHLPLDQQQVEHISLHGQVLNADLGEPVLIDYFSETEIVSPQQKNCEKWKSCAKTGG